MSGFRHWAFIYRSEAEFADRLVPFIREGIAADGAILVALDHRKIALLAEQLGPDTAKVRFEDIREIGRNPGAIISAWQEFADTHHGRSLWGIGEPAWPGRSALEYDECRQHECLLNTAFEHAENFNLVCPYDGRALAEAVLARVSDSHRTIETMEGVHASQTFVEPSDVMNLLADPLAPVPAAAPSVTFELATLRELRRVARALGHGAGLEGDLLEDFILAVNELAENSVRHGPGTGRMRIWVEDDNLVAEVTDAGRLEDPLIGRRRPRGSDDGGGFGMWLTHQVCDLVQVRSTEAGTIVRAYMHAPGPALAA